jgi:hypothetical protein
MGLGDDIVMEDSLALGSCGVPSSSSPSMFSGISFGSAVKGSPASVTSEDGEELESSMEMFEDFLAGGNGIMRGKEWEGYKDGFAMRKVRKR